MILEVFFYIFVVVAVLQIIYYFTFITFLKHKNEEKTDTEYPLSVIVCAKNEAKNLKKIIPKLLSQKYKTFQLVLINDRSTDETADVLEQFAKIDNRIHVVNIESNENFWRNKKYALTLGIRAAKYEHLLFTDADCIPHSNQWIQLMSQQFNSKKNIVLGYGKYKASYSLINLLVRYETLLTAVQFFSFTIVGMPYMAVGRNLAYHRSEFFKVNGFSKHIKLLSGDDDLFIRDASNHSNTTICTYVEGSTISETPKNFKEWFYQKRRHISTAKHYKILPKIILTLFFVSKVLFWFSLSFAFANNMVITSIILISYLLTEFIVIGLSCKKMKEPSITLFLPFLEIGLILFQITIFIANSISKPTLWK